MKQFAACENCGRTVPVTDLDPVEWYTFERNSYGTPRAVLAGQRMFCRNCRGATDPGPLRANT